MTRDRQDGGGSRRLPEMTWRDVAVPGCYLVTRTGRLIRVTGDALAESRRKPATMRGSWVALISADPGERVIVLREIASAHGYFVNF